MNLMKYIAVFFLLVGFIPATHAQTAKPDTTTPELWKDITLGPLFSAGQAVNAGTVGSGTKTSMAFAFSVGADADFPLNPNIALHLGVAYDARGVNFHEQNDANNKVDYTFGYFEFRPEFRFSGFLIGVGLGIPVSASATGGGLTKAPSLGASAMGTLFELRLGGEIPVIQTDNGTFYFTLEGSYAFTSIVSNSNDAPLPYYDVNNVPPTTDNNGPLASAELGIKYLFDLTHN